MVNTTFLTSGATKACSFLDMLLDFNRNFFVSDTSYSGFNTIAAVFTFLD